MMKQDVEGVVVSGQDLTEFAAAIFRSAGMSRDYAAAQADILVWANLRGLDSHGVLRIPWYIDLIDRGDMVVDAKPEIVSETPATALIDAHGAPGPVGTLAGVDMAVRKAREAGASWITVRNVTHNGALAYYTNRIPALNLIGVTTVSSPPNMAPYGAKAAGVHNSPISIGIPAARHAPVVLDMATSVAAGGKIYFAADRGMSIPEGWALDKHGNSTTDPNKAKIWLPFSGPKGSGLAMMFECWSSLLADNALCTPRIKGEKTAEEEQQQNVMVAAVDVSAFLDPQEYARKVDEFVDALKGLPRSGHDPILVPGERESQVYEERVREGVTIPLGTTQRISSIARRFDVPSPW
ncbi:MAG TPA: Ldh family oxidoreductase [Rhizobiaceae bacterium]|nr:Ldh family oxidoreductase [Rhizobiaceae bacterium]